MKQSSPLIAVFAANGTVGGRLAQTLLAADERVRVIVRHPERASDLAALGAEVVQGDLDQPATLESALEGVERIALITPYVQHQLQLVEHVVSAAQRVGARFIVRMSASGADEKADGPLPRSHGLSEIAVKRSGLDWAVVRPTFFQDNYVKFSAEIIKAQGVWYGASAGQATSYVHSADIAEVMAELLRRPKMYKGQTLTLTGPSAHTEAEVAGWLTDTAGYDIRYVDLPPEQLYAGMVSQGMPEWLAADMIFFENVKSAGWAQAVSSDVQRVLGRPARDLKTFIAGHADAFRR